MSPPLAQLPAWDEERKAHNVVVETPKGSRNKFDYEAEPGLFRYGKTLPAGADFPFDFGFIPSTRGDDGDPLDVLLLLGAPALSGLSRGRATHRSHRGRPA